MNTERIEAEGIVLRFILQEGARWAMPKERVALCMREIIPLKTTVEVHKVEGTNRVNFRNLQVCGSVWMCPVCAARITEVRRKELQAALLTWKGSLLMITYTLSHNRSMTLPDLLESLLDAYRRLKSGEFYQQVKSEYYIDGSVRTLELTYGDNGWHCHIHELVFYTKPHRQIEDKDFTEGQIEALRGKLFLRWAKVLSKHNKTASYAHGIDVRTAKSDIADYIAKYGHEPLEPKWDIAHEITKQPAKKGKIGGKTPMQLLYEYTIGDMQSGSLFKVYCHTLKGKNQLVWTKGMRELLGLGVELPDGEIAETLEPEYTLYATITAKQWQWIIRHYERSEILREAQEKTPAQFLSFVKELTEGID